MQLWSKHVLHVVLDFSDCMNNMFVCLIYYIKKRTVSEVKEQILPILWCFPVIMLLKVTCLMFYLFSSLKLIQSTLWKYSRVLCHLFLQVVMWASLLWLRKHECLRKSFSERCNSSEAFAWNLLEIKICVQNFLHSEICEICQTLWVKMTPVQKKPEQCTYNHGHTPPTP